MSHMIRRAASSLTHSRQFCSQVSVFQESENWTLLAKNLLSVALVLGIFKYTDASNTKGTTQLSRICAELRLERERNYNTMVQLKELRIQAQKAKSR